MANIISKMPLLLTWRSHRETVGQIYQSHLKFLEDCLHEWGQRIKRRDAAQSDKLVTAFNQLPVASRHRFLTAPHTYRVMRRKADCFKQECQFFCDSMRAERCRLHQDITISEPTWTALGDYCYSAPNLNHTESLATPESGRQYRAPCIAGVIPLDAFSPYSAISIPGDKVKKTAHTTGECELILSRLNSAMICIEEVKPSVFDLITLVTKVVVVKQDPEAPGSFGSSSWSSYIGKIALTNAHSETVNTAALANALVHESIHSLLYMVEVREPLFQVESGAAEQKISSPWTGRSLYLPSYLHACFVWFGLSCFWQLALEAEVFSRKEAESCLARSVGGFRKKSLVGLLAEVRESINPETWDSIQIMQESLTG